jgi:hypothetical protein
LKKPDTDYLSESNFKCLNKVIQENKSLKFEDLTKKSHDYAYNEIKNKTGI